MSFQTDIDYTYIYDNLEKHNGHKHGNEKIYNNQTGHQMHAWIFIGPTYYFRFNHMVDLKINAWGKGPMTQLTRDKQQEDLEKKVDCILEKWNGMVSYVMTFLVLFQNI